MSATVAQKKEFISAIAVLLAKDMALKSVAIQVQDKLKDHPASKLSPKWASEWQAACCAGPHMGWATVDEAEKKLLQFFGLED